MGHRSVAGASTLAHRLTSSFDHWYPTVYQCGTIVSIWLFIDMGPSVIFQTSKRHRKANVDSPTNLVLRRQYPNVYRHGIIGHFQTFICRRKIDIGPRSNLFLCPAASIFDCLLTWDYRSSSDVGPPIHLVFLTSIFDCSSTWDHWSFSDVDMSQVNQRWPTYLLIQMSVSDCLLTWDHRSFLNVNTSQES